MRKRQVIARILRALLLCLLVAAVLASSLGVFSPRNKVDATAATGAALQSGEGHAYLFCDPTRGTELYVNTSSGVYRFTAPDGYDTGTVHAVQMHINADILIQINDFIHGFNFNCNINFVANHCLGTLTDRLDKDHPRYYRINAPTVGAEVHEDAVVPATTMVLGNTTLSYLSSVSADESILTFRQATRQLSSLSIGDVIASGVGTFTPYGLLRKVITIVLKGHGIVVYTAPATLEEAIEECQINSSWHLLADGSAVPLDNQGSLNYTNSMLSSAAAKRVDSINTAASTQSSPSSTGFYIDIKDIVLYDDDGNPATTGDQITASGSVNVDPSFNFGLTVENWTLTEAHFSTTFTETAQLELSAKVPVVDIHPKVEVYRQYLDPITVWVGLPVVILPVLTVNIGLDATVSVGITTSVTQTANVTAGLEYTHGTWSPVTNFSTSFSWDPPKLTAACEVKGYVGPQLNFLLYGLTGPYGEVRGYLELDADVYATPWWELYGGLESDVGFRMEVLGHNLADYELPLAIGYRTLLAQASVARPWPMFAHDQQHTGRGISSIPETPTTKWVYNTGVGGLFSSLSLSDDGTAYVGSSDGNLYAVGSNGILQWSYDAGDRIDFSSPAVGIDGTIYVGAEEYLNKSDGYLYAINSDGTLRWRFAIGVGPVSPGVSSSPAIGDDGTVYIGSTNGSLYAINPNGSLKWSFATNADISVSSPTIGSDGTVYIGSMDKNVYAMNPDGTLKWRFQTGNFIQSSPAIASDGTIYIGTFYDDPGPGKIFAVNPNGSLKWSIDTDSAALSPALGADGTVFVTTFANNSVSRKLYAVAPNGTLKWSFDISPGVICPPVVGADGTVCVGSYYGDLYAIKLDGSLKWGLNVSGGVTSLVVGDNSTIYVGSADGKLYAIGD